VMAADWEEIRRLAADFQRAQFADTVQRLSERNCIEIISKLIQEKKLDVVHTLDGKEYITPAQISREIRDELYVHGGRINIVELQQSINVDWVHVESRASDIAKSGKGVQLILGQLIDDTYLDHLAEEVNDKLQEAGLISVAELCKNYDLPGDFLSEELSKRLGKLIQGEKDQYNQGVIFTPAFVARHRARIRGLFSAITTVSSMISTFGFQEHLLYSVLEDLVGAGRLKGNVVGGRRDKAVYIPDIYSKTQNTWVDSFLHQNGYLDFDALLRLGIPDPSSYIKKRFKSKKLLFLTAACISQVLLDQVEASVEETVNSVTWTDIQSILPSCLSVEDVGMVINQALRNMNVHSSVRVMGDTFVVSERFISNCVTMFDEAMHLKAQKEYKNNPVFLITEEDLKQASILNESLTSLKKDKKETERRKKVTEGSGSAKAGGGGNAREIRIRKTRKKGRRDEDSDEETGMSQIRGKQPETVFMSQEDLASELRERVSDCPEEILCELSEHLVRPLNKTYHEVLRTVFMSSTGSLSGANKKKSTKDVQEEITNLYNNIRLFEKGTKLFSDETQVLLSKHILKTLCTDVTNILFNFLAGDLMMSAENPSTISSEVRVKILSKLPEETRGPLLKLHSCLNSKTTEDFLSNIEMCTEVCGFMLKKGDKKKERQALFLHRQALIEQLQRSEDPALVLHLTSVLLFQATTQCMLHAPGRCVPQIISILTGRIPTEQQQLLSVYQNLVVKQLVSKSQSKKQEEDQSEEQDEEARSVRNELVVLTPQVKDLVL
ncbi:unnamed protein product, partial [Tetraodon nigroviridis]